MGPTAALAVAAAAAGVAAVISAAPARADDASYLAALDAAGLLLSAPANTRLSAGHRFCTELRSGSSPDEVAADQSLPSFGLPSVVDDLRTHLRPVIDVAQYELCPDTLG